MHFFKVHSILSFYICFLVSIILFITSSIKKMFQTFLDQHFLFLLFKRLLGSIKAFWAILIPFHIDFPLRRVRIYLIFEDCALIYCIKRILKKILIFAICVRWIVYLIRLETVDIQSAITKFKVFEQQTQIEYSSNFVVSPYISVVYIGKETTLKEMLETRLMINIFYHFDCIVLCFLYNELLNKKITIIICWKKILIIYINSTKVNKNFPDLN